MSPAAVVMLSDAGSGAVCRLGRSLLLAPSRCYTGWSPRGAMLGMNLKDKRSVA